MTRTTTVRLVALMTTAACAAIWLWALRPLGFASYLTSSGSTDAEIIRQYWPHRLVHPEWVTDVPSRLMNWHRTETAARLVVVLGLWFLSSGGAVLGFVRPWKREPNQAASGNGPIARLFHSNRFSRAVPEQRRWLKTR